jgi:hypothetical protein
MGTQYERPARWRRRGSKKALEQQGAKVAKAVQGFIRFFLFFALFAPFC